MNKSQSISNSGSQKLLHLTQISCGQSLITYEINEQWMYNYIYESKFLAKLSLKFPSIKTNLSIKTLQIYNCIQIDLLRKQVQKYISCIQKITLEDQNLTEEQYENYFLKDKTIQQIIKSFGYSCFYEGNINLFTKKKMVSENVLRKKNQLQSYKKETLVYDCGKDAVFQKYQSKELQVLIQTLHDQVKQHFQKFASMKNLKLIRSFTSDGKIKFETIGFNKIYIDFYDAIFEFLFTIKTAVIKFSCQNKILEQFQSTLKKQQEKFKTIEVKFRYHKDGYVIAIGDDTFTEDILLCINCKTYNILQEFLDSSDKVFIKSDTVSLRKCIKSRVNYKRLDMQILEIQTDEPNFKQCIKIVSQYIYQHKENQHYFLFDSLHHKQAFLIYFLNQYKGKVKNDKGLIITYYVSKANESTFKQSLQKTYSQIKNNLISILVPSTYLVNKTSLYSHQNLHLVPIGYCDNAFVLRKQKCNLSIEISHRIQKQDTNCIVSCFNNEKLVFYDQFIEPLLDEPTLTSIKKINKKKEISIHGIYLSFCKNLILHKFGKLNEDMVFQTLNKIFCQLTNQIQNITLVAPEKYEYCDEYVADSVHILLNNLDKFPQLERLIVVCRPSQRQRFFKIIQKVSNKIQKVVSKTLTQYHLFHHQCLKFHSIQCQILNSHILSPLLLSILYQHYLSYSQELIVNIPLKNTKFKQYVVNLKSRQILDPLTRDPVSDVQIRVKMKSSNELLKTNIRSKKIKYDLVVLYLSENKLSGKLYKFNFQTCRMIQVNQNFQNVGIEKSFKFHEKTDLKCQIVEGYNKQIEILINSVKFQQQPIGI